MLGAFTRVLYASRRRIAAPSGGTSQRRRRWRRALAKRSRKHVFPFMTKPFFDCRDGLPRPSTARFKIYAFGFFDAAMTFQRSLMRPLAPSALAAARFHFAWPRALRQYAAAALTLTPFSRTLFSFWARGMPPAQEAFCCDVSAAARSRQSRCYALIHNARDVDIEVTSSRPRDARLYMISSWSRGSAAPPTAIGISTARYFYHDAVINTHAASTLYAAVTFIYIIAAADISFAAPTLAMARQEAVFAAACSPSKRRALARPTARRPAEGRGATASLPILSPARHHAPAMMA